MQKNDELGRYMKKVSDQQKQIKELKEEVELAKVGIKELSVAVDIVINTFINAFGSPEDDKTVLRVKASTYEDTKQYDIDCEMDQDIYVFTRTKKENKETE